MLEPNTIYFVTKFLNSSIKSFFACNIFYVKSLNGVNKFSNKFTFLFTILDNSMLFDKNMLFINSNINGE